MTQNRTPSMSPEDFFAGHTFSTAVFTKVRSMLEQLGPVEVHASKSQVGFRRKRSFAYLWTPGQYLKHPTAEVVLSIDLGRRDASSRFKEVVHPAPNHWMHHLEIHALDEIDAEVEEWLREASDRAS